MTWVCAYCNTPNPDREKACQSCGAPYTQPVMTPPPAHRSERIHPISPPPVDPKTFEQVRANTENLEKVVQQGRYWYAILWRTLAEVFAIALSALLLGVIAGGINVWWLGVLAGSILGICVGISNKPYWLAAVSAPAGVILGAVLWLPLWLITGQPGGMLFTASISGILLALLGSKKRPKNLWENLRPLLGLIGGLFFAALGSLLTQGLIWVIQSALKN